MKIFGAGRLRDKTDEALQYSLALDCVDCMTIGVENQQEFSQLLTKFPAASTRG